MFTNIVYFSEKDFFFYFLFPITKIEKYMFIVFLFILFFFLFSVRSTNLIPSFFQSFVENIYEFLMITINQQAGKLSQKLFPFFLLLFNFILFSNIIGLIPFSFTATSHIFQTFSMGFSIIIALTVIGFLIHGLNFFKLFVPSGAPTILIPLLIIIEIISYISRAFSLSIRLFANMMSGHTLLNIISSFSVKLINIKLINYSVNFSSIIKFFIFLIGGILPMIMIGGIFFLELGIGFLQAYVFMVLIGIYLNDSFKGGH
jgi:ATP synthase subunit 6